MTRLFYCFSIIFVGALGRNLKTICPPQEDIPTCTCQRSPLWIACKNVHNVWDLKSIVNYLSDYDVYRFRLEHSSLMYLPKGLFINFPITDIEIFKTEIFGLESDNATEMFKGLENSLQRMDFYDTVGLDSWKWSAFAGLKKLEIILMKTSDLTKIDKDFSLISPESIRLIQLLSCEIEYIHQSAFQNHNELRTLELAENRIIEVNRDMLPKPAKHLAIFNLKGNKIEVIPDDFFTEMPSLRLVDLSKNRIKFLSPGLFKPLENERFAQFKIEFNNIHCCSGLKFLIKTNYQKRILGSCSFPDILKNISLAKLKEGDLDHGHC